jgi:large subunit ribosomal protein L29
MTMTGQEVRELTDEEISIELRNLRSKMHTLRTQVVTEKVEDVSSFRNTRRDIARLLTERKARIIAKAQKR